MDDDKSDLRRSRNNSPNRFQHLDRREDGAASGSSGYNYKSRDNTFPSSFGGWRTTRYPENKRSIERPPKSLGFTFLDDLLKKDDEKIMLVLIKEREGFTRLLEKDLSPDILVIIVRILKKVSSSAYNSIKYNILHSAFNEKFVGKLRTFIACLPTQEIHQKRKSAHFWKNPNEFWINLIEICEDLLQTTPTFAYKSLPVLVTSLKVYIPIIEQEHNVQVGENIKKRIKKINEVIQTHISDDEEKTKETKKSFEESTEPPDDFRKISIYPTHEELVGGRGFLRENVTKGPYQNVNHYLDVQFRLLREDFVGPLRDGVGNYRSSSLNRLENVRIHKEVRFLGSETINEFYTLRIQFVTKKKKKINLENSRRFMYGSLLCFTKDNFQTLFFGKVAQRKVEDLEKGQVIVAFDEKPDIDYNNSYLMVECNVYFEPYFHVLTVLQSMTEENFPMERYIIRVNSVVQPPEYLTRESSYVVEGQTFNPLSEWPNENLYNLNESQMIAFKAAVAQEICVIQGPPGTGKTYLGLKIANTLLTNTESWYDHTPILVICYTNHALDQFLEGLIPVTKHIVRVGGQSKNERLAIYNLRNKSERDDSVAAKKREVQQCLSEIKRITQNLQHIELYDSVFSFKNFENIVPEFQGSWFEQAKNDEIIHWLLEGSGSGQHKSIREHTLQNLQVQDEFNRIGINDDFVEEPQAESDIFNDHIISTFDTIFVEVLGRSFFKNSTFLITLASVLNQLDKFEDDLLQLTQVENPSLQQLIREEEIYIYLEDLKEKYAYLKHQLSEGRKQLNYEEKDIFIDLNKPYKMNFEDRWRLYFYWLNLYKHHESEVLQMTCERFPNIYKEYESLREIEDVRAMKNALVVGMTTTSAARLRASLQTLKNPIVIVEEAAEVLEAHIVTSITKHCKHLILIGDHKQLRPNTANYSMDKQYRLGISLFERMIINDIHCYTLKVQHRMRPEISCLIRPTIYDFLEDHPSVFQRPQILGVDKCLFFIDHDHLEEDCEGTSKVNQHEVNFLMYLARHLVLNGYSPENITILAAYSGQYNAFKNEKKEHLDLLKDVKIAVLDNYQGEESEIILLSLVRSNEDFKIGFLAIENRVCVALSRAKNAMYIMGNMSQLSRDNKLWQKIKSTLENKNALGKELPLRCQIHQDQVTSVKCETDFYSVSEGGCSKKCDVELHCGHKCTSLCHIRDRTHLNYNCSAECKKKLCTADETHVCKKMCYQDCGPCNYLVRKTLACGHEVHVPCHINSETYKCQVMVPAQLPCGHKTDKPCYSDAETYRCPHICDVQVQPCGHACEMLCHFRKDPKHQEYQCKKPCGKFMKGCTVEEEDHRCKKLCYQECDPCTITVRKRRTVCPHLYDVPCNFDVDERCCEKPCTKELKCGHQCKAKCNQPCQQCQIKIFKTNPICKHAVKVRCCDPPDRKFCTKQCPLELSCGHPCTKKCNEPCTTQCTALVSCSGITSQCGHVVKRMECHMTTSNVDSKLLIRFCSQPCRKELKCGHVCSGSCGECAQGRVHKRCAEKCGTRLVCDHECDVPCRQACQPCRRICEYRCEHSSCRKTCGEVCTPCKEKCVRRCKHQWCTKYCGDICDVPPCIEPCPEKLRCGHPCIGFCGDPCPPKCLTCNRDEVLDVFFGTETADARYVLLNDCKHIVESSGMEMWLQQNDQEISYKLCPRCKTAIRTTQRYSDYIKGAIKDVALVKLKVNGKPEEISEKRKEIEFNLKLMLRKCGPLSLHYPPIKKLLETMFHRVKPDKRGTLPNISIFEAQSLKSKLQIIEHILDICCNEHVNIATSKEIFFPQIHFILHTLSRDAYFITSQEVEDLNFEINRLSRMVDFSCIEKSPQFSFYSKNNETVKNLITSIENNLFDCKKFTSENNDLLKDLLRNLNDTLKSGISISDHERKQILQAMGFSKGHWFKCPNGHVYAIGECGGAMEEAKCNECGEKIGGTSHQLLSTNAVATEMDGAVFGAWSTRANLLNYNLGYLRDQ